jgi:hypothetical protein
MSDTRIPLCVPYWDERDALNAGAQYDREFGFFIARSSPYIDDVHSWLPRMYRDEQSPVLVPEMLPVTSWENNVRTAVTPEHWNKLRRYCYQAAGHRCEICGAKGDPYIECHELWKFVKRGDERIQRLERLIALDEKCHKAYHLGFAKRIGRYDDVLERIQMVNGWNDQELKAGLDEAWEVWKRRSQFKWTLDIEWIFSPAGYRYV